MFLVISACWRMWFVGIYEFLLLVAFKNYCLGIYYAFSVVYYKLDIILNEKTLYYKVIHNHSGIHIVNKQTHTNTINQKKILSVRPNIRKNIQQDMNHLNQ